MSLIDELRRRNVFRVAIAYVLLGWAVLQGADFLLDLAGAPEWVMRVFAIAGLVGFPFALFFAWAFELTPEGVKREKDLDRSQSIAPQTGKRLNRVIIGLLLLVIVLMAVERVFVVGETDTDSAPLATAAAPSIAVLPFVNMSADPDNEYFSEGVAEEILNVLARIPELKVTARTSAFSYKGSEATVAQIARELGVNHVLEGSVRKALPFALAAAGVHDEALSALRQSLERQRDFYPVTLIRVSPLTGNFACRPDAEAFFARLDLPPPPEPPACTEL